MAKEQPTPEVSSGAPDATGQRRLLGRREPQRAAGAGDWRLRTFPVAGLNGWGRPLGGPRMFFYLSKKVSFAGGTPALPPILHPAGDSRRRPAMPGVLNLPAWSSIAPPPAGARAPNSPQRSQQPSRTTLSPFLPLAGFLRGAQVAACFPVFPPAPVADPGDLLYSLDRHGSPGKRRIITKGCVER